MRALQSLTGCSVLTSSNISASHVQAIKTGQQVHSDVVKRGYGENVYAGSALLDMYAKCGTVEDARKVFQYMPECTSMSWNPLIAGYTELGNLESCLQLLKQTEYKRVELEDGKFAPECGFLEDARRAFDSAIGCRDLVSWNSMQGACLEHGQMELAF